MKKIFSILSATSSVVVLSTVAASCSKQESSQPVTSPEATPAPAPMPKPSNQEDKQLQEFQARVQILQYIDPTQYVKYSELLSKMKKGDSETRESLVLYLHEVNEIISDHERIVIRLQGQIGLAEKQIEDIKLIKILAFELNNAISQINVFLTEIKKLNFAQSSIDVLKNKLTQLEQKINEFTQAEQKVNTEITSETSKLNTDISLLQAQLESLEKTNPTEADKLKDRLKSEILNVKDNVSSLAQIKELIAKVKQLESEANNKVATPEEQKALKLATFNNLKDTVLDLIEQINQYDPNYATKLKGQITELDKDLSKATLKEIEGKLAILLQLQQEFNKYISIHNQLKNQIESILSTAKNDLLPSLDYAIYKTETNNIYKELNDYLSGITNLNLPNDDLNKLIEKTNNEIAKIKQQKEAITQDEIQRQKELKDLKSQAEANLNNIGQVTKEIEKYDNAYAQSIKDETSHIKEQLKEFVPASTLKEIVKQLADILKPAQENLAARNSLLDKLKNTSQRNIETYIKKFTRVLFTEGENSLLSQANKIKDLLNQDFTTKSLAQLRIIDDKYLEMFKEFENNYNTIMQQTDEIKTIALALKNILDQKDAKSLTEKEQEIKQYIDSLPLGNIELLPGNNVISTLQKLKGYQAELQASSNN
ncbi:hypothetical protein [Mycoplasma sp. Sp33II]|uniref:hypothetical protein n=1 Tax=unclassified Mycoplasma TaxID=2683645 RepID=UPI003AABDE97